jgi:hypothetical protein
MVWAATGLLTGLGITPASAFAPEPAAVLIGEALLSDGTPASSASGLLSALDGAGDDHPVAVIEADAAGRFTVPIPDDPDLFTYARQTDGRLRLVVALSKTATGTIPGTEGVYQAIGAAEAAVEEGAAVYAGRDVFVSPAPAQYVLTRVAEATDDPPPAPALDVNAVRGKATGTRRVTVCRTYAWRANCPVNKYGAYGWQTMVIQDVTEQMYHWDPGCYVPPGTIDGYFGGGTKFAVEFYQMCQGLSDDGIVGYQTWGYFWNQPARKGLEHRIKNADGDGYCWPQNGSQVCIKDNHCVPSFGAVDNFVDVNPYDAKIYGWQQHRIGDNSNAQDERWTVLDNRNGMVGKCHYMTDNFG